MMSKLFIKKVENTTGGPSPTLGIEFTDGTSCRIPKDVPKSMLWDATVVILVDEGNKEIITMVKVVSFNKDGKPNGFEHIYGEPLELDGSEEIVDCKKHK